MTFLFSFLVIWSNFSERPEVFVPEKIIPRAVSSREIVRGDVSKRQVIFTFDGGDGILSARKILGALAKHKVKGTFFLTGKFIEAHQAITKQINEEGHEIFSHTYDHPHLTEISSKEISLEMRKTDQILEQTIGKSSGPYFRAPYGDRDGRVITEMFRDGYQSVYWTIDAMDWLEKEGKTKDEVKNLIASSLAPGNIYLMHIGDNITGDILDEVFSNIESQGYKIVSLTQGL
jgi:peptidoglycan/xylan/chitin deacetylase (PgdA/CDA1 family)